MTRPPSKFFIRPKILRVDVDLAGPSAHDFTVIPSMGSIRVGLFCVQLDKWDWITRKAFIRFVHAKFRQAQNIVLHMKLKADVDECHIDKPWDYRIERLVKEGLYLEHTMWTLSTFGGALSAMGDFVDEFVGKALKVSLKQREIAERLDSPILISRCNMYIGLALAQMGKFMIAFRILRQEFRNAQALDSDFLMNCARGLWSKISYMKKHWRERTSLEIVRKNSTCLNFLLKSAPVTSETSIKC